MHGRSGWKPDLLVAAGRASPQRVFVLISADGRIVAVAHNKPFSLSRGPSSLSSPQTTFTHHNTRERSREGADRMLALSTKINPPEAPTTQSPRVGGRYQLYTEKTNILNMGWCQGNKKKQQPRDWAKSDQEWVILQFPIIHGCILCIPFVY